MTDLYALDLKAPGSRMAREAAELLRDTAGTFLYQHSHRVYHWAALRGRRKALAFDPELLYVAAMFHDLGLIERFNTSPHRFEVDGAHAARDFLETHRVSRIAIDKVWLAIALHTTPGIPEHLHPEAQLLHVGAGMDVAGRCFHEFTEEERAAVLRLHPREEDFGPRIIDTFHDALAQRPATTFGTFNDDFIAYREAAFKRVDICCVILSSPWEQADGRGTSVDTR